ncbi:MAG: class I SAM-dependent methyltransferase [Desulfobulbus sp.]|nr:class I SAM-dependent methyltransferase [Desulfobulbus sp.]
MNIAVEKATLNAQCSHWEKTYREHRDMFGEEASAPAQYAAAFLQAKGEKNILELGAGQGRDALFFANQGFHVHALDYSNISVAEIQKKAIAQGHSQNISAICHDARQALPFPNNLLDACYAHMLFCMAFTTPELHFLSDEIRRVLKPKGICIYTVRHKGDSHYKKGMHKGDEMYEMGGFIVHFFSKEKIHELAAGYKLLDITEFEEGPLPRKLFRVTLEKM